MARVVMKHPRDFRPGDVVVIGGHRIKIAEVLGWNEREKHFEFMLGAHRIGLSGHMDYRVER